MADRAFHHDYWEWAVSKNYVFSSISAAAGLDCPNLHNNLAPHFPIAKGHESYILSGSRAKTTDLLTFI